MFLNITFISILTWLFINAVGATEKIFYENELYIIQDKDESNVKILCFKSSHSHSSYSVLHLHQWNIFN